MDRGFLEDKEKKQKKLRQNEEKDLILPIKDNEKCQYCDSLRLDMEIQKNFNQNICYDCKFSRLHLITKTTAMKDFLLTDEELAKLPFLPRPNPRSGIWRDMQLYDIEQVKAKAIERFGSLDEVKKEKNRRIITVFDRKKKKVREKVKDLRKKTLVDTKMTTPKHIHDFIDQKNGQAKCECGMTIDFENMLSDDD
ncbi:DNA excision repair protein XPA/XPAC/RAD14 [Pseudoloma neurophilia]|uniref:DNA excision repair protein XPA/XPAC/RAD14 n=1 Tax=Pseudoloma neurophilia TaxID=146866 RepID=A0A0R0M577_9MICR|nr:DNA excision repair protein XPA/XPAC/RAD14 [Pseudoloma neurophilia]